MDIQTSRQFLAIYQNLAEVLRKAGIQANRAEAEDFFGNIHQMTTQTLQALIVACTQELVDRAK
jgi:hypothetical protein